MGWVGSVCREGLGVAGVGGVSTVVITTIVLYAYFLVDNYNNSARDDSSRGTASTISGRRAASTDASAAGCGSDCATVVSIGSCNGVRIRLCRRLTPVAIGGFISLTGSNFCSNLAFREVVANFVVRNNSPGNSNANNDGGAVGNRFTRGNIRGGLSRAENIVSVTHSGSPSDTDSRFFVIRTSDACLSNRCTTFNGMAGNVSVISGVYGSAPIASSGNAIRGGGRPIVGSVGVRRGW